MTLNFMPSVSDQGLELLVHSVNQLQWIPLQVRVGQFVIRGRSALTLDLLEGDQELGCLVTRLAPLSLLAADAMSATDTNLTRMCNRNQSNTLHVTVARSRRGVAIDTLRVEPPTLTFTLGELVLFESLLDPNGTQYVRLAEATSKAKPLSS